MRLVIYNRLGAPPPPEDEPPVPLEDDDELLLDELLELDDEELELEEEELELLDDELLEELELLEEDDELLLAGAPCSKAPMSIADPTTVRTSAPLVARCGCSCTGCAAATAWIAAGRRMPPTSTAGEVAWRRKSFVARLVNCGLLVSSVPSCWTWK